MNDRQRYASKTVVNGERLDDHLGLVAMVVSRYSRRAGAAIGIDDLWQAGMIGLVEGLRRFDASRGVRVATFVTWAIRHRVATAWRDGCRTVRVPVHRWRSCDELAPEFSLDAPMRGCEESRLDTLATAEPTPEESALAAERAVPVRTALASLPERMQVILFHNAVDEEPCSKIGRRLARPIGRERARQLRDEALARMRAALGSG